MDVLKRINNLRLERDWSIYRLSLESNLPQSTLTNMFNRETLPSISTLECLCAAFGITMSEFFEDPTNRKAENLDFLELYTSLAPDTQALVFDLLKKLAKKT